MFLVLLYSVFLELTFEEEMINKCLCRELFIQFVLNYNHVRFLPFI